MRVAIISFGSQGDTRPLIALSQGLVRTGHQAILLADPEFAALAAEAGLEFVPLAGGSVRDLFTDREIAKPSRRGFDVWGVMQVLMKHMGLYTETWGRLDSARQRRMLTWSSRPGSPSSSAWPWPRRSAFPPSRHRSGSGRANPGLSAGYYPGTRDAAHRLPDIAQGRLGRRLVSHGTIRAAAPARDTGAAEMALVRAGTPDAAPASAAAGCRQPNGCATPAGLA